VLDILSVGCREFARFLVLSPCAISRNINYNVKTVVTYAEALEAIESREFDACLVNFDLADKSGLDLIRKFAASEVSMPFILIADEEDDQVDVEAMASGAVDYFVKDQITAPLLRRAISYGIERKRTERRLAALAVTGLANRRGAQLAIFQLDLDRFKQINDTIGHMMGDHLLMKIADCLRECCRDIDTVARLGGDEFAVIATHFNDHDSVEMMARKILANIWEPFTIVGHTVHASASMGITLYPNDEDNFERLLANVDMAMYRAKTDGGNSYRFFDANLNGEIKRQRRLGREMRRALEGKEFFAHYQPLFDTKSGRVVSAEALVRWRHPSEGFICPDEFIPIAESPSLIDRLGERMLRTACIDCKEWQSQGLENIAVAVNVSPSQFRRSDIVGTVMRALRKSRLNPALLELELTEATVMQDFEEAANALQRLRNEGMRIAIDDFGTGYSSMTYLKHFPVDRLKIDQSFISGVETEFGDRAITRAIIRLASGLGIDVTAEEVENQAQLEFLRSKRCNSVQGYLLGRPATLNEFVESISGQNSSLSVAS
jgi:diguanylate cyclase (GGDEF)-like protein